MTNCLFLRSFINSSGPFAVRLIIDRSKFFILFWSLDSFNDLKKIATWTICYWTLFSGDFTFSLDDEKDRSQEMAIKCFHFNRDMDPDEGIRAITDQLAIIELKQNFTVSDYIAPIRVCTSNDVMNDTTVLRSVGIGEWVKDKALGPSTKLRVRLLLPNCTCLQLLKLFSTQTKYIVWFFLLKKLELFILLAPI